MISTDMRLLADRLKAHGDADMLKGAFMAIFLQNLRDLADQAERLEMAQVNPTNRRVARQLELIVGGKA